MSTAVTVLQSQAVRLPIAPRPKRNHRCTEQGECTCQDIPEDSPQAFHGRIVTAVNRRMARFVSSSRVSTARFRVRLSRKEATISIFDSRMRKRGNAMINADHGVRFNQTAQFIAMKRLGRILWHICVAISMALCMAVIVLWVRSYFICDCVWWSDIDRVDPSSSSSTLYNVDRRLASTTRGLEVSYVNGTNTILNSGWSPRHVITWQQVDRVAYPLFFNPSWKNGVDLRAAGLRISGGHESGRNFVLIYNTHGCGIL